MKEDLEVKWDSKVVEGNIEGEGERKEKGEERRKWKSTFFVEFPPVLIIQPLVYYRTVLRLF